jgi:hypothetical protein
MEPFLRQLPSVSLPSSLRETDDSTAEAAKLCKPTLAGPAPGLLAENESRQDAASSPLTGSFSPRCQDPESSPARLVKRNGTSGVSVSRFPGFFACRNTLRGANGLLSLPCHSCSHVLAELSAGDIFLASSRVWVPCNPGRC